MQTKHKVICALLVERLDKLLADVEALVNGKTAPLQAGPGGGRN